MARQMVDQTEAAARLAGDKLKPRTLEKWRVEGRGPAFHKIGSRVFYDIRDLDAWLDSQRRKSTSDKGEAA